MMERRGFLALLGLSVLSARSAFAQDGGSAPGSINDLIRIVSTPPLLLELLREMDALWLVLVLGDPALPPSTAATPEQRETYSRYRNQLADPGIRTKILSNLQSDEVRQQLTQLTTSLDGAVQQLRQHLIQIGISESSRLIGVFTRAFRVFTLLLTAISSDNDKWYCHCYGLELLCRG